MKAVIDGKRYDTETAEYIAGAGSQGISMSDFNYWEAALYKTKKGAYFVAGEGGALSPYGESYAGASHWGERITPKTKEEAFEWAQRFCDPDRVQAEFADMIEDA